MFDDTKSSSFKELVANDPIKAAFALCKPVEKKEIKKVLDEEEKLRRTLSNTNELISNLLPVEEAQLPTIQAKKLQIERRLRGLEITKLDQYRIFNLDSLTWRDKDGYPRLAVFNIESPLFEITCQCEGTKYRDKKFQNKIVPQLPQAMEDCYADVVKMLSKWAEKTIWNCDVREYITIRLRSQFSVLIPQSVKNEIKKTRKLFESIFIVADVPHWEINKTSLLTDKDPLVVGYDGETYWLIACFDPTPLEVYIVGECRKPTK